MPQPHSGLSSVRCSTQHLSQVVHTAFSHALSTRAHHRGLPQEGQSWVPRGAAPAQPSPASMGPTRLHVAFAREPHVHPETRQVLPHSSQDNRG